MFGGADQAERLLATAQFQPESELRGVPFDGLLQQLERQGELMIITANPRSEPGNEPTVRRQHHGLLQTIIRARFLAREEHIRPRQPYVRGVAVFLDCGIRKHERPLEISPAAESNRFSRQKIGFVWKALERFV